MLGDYNRVPATATTYYGQLCLRLANLGVFMAILAKKSGWMIGVLIVREAEKAVIVKAWDDKKERRIPKDDNSQKLFECTTEAQKWIMSKSAP